MTNFVIGLMYRISGFLFILSLLPLASGCVTSSEGANTFTVVGRDSGSELTRDDCHFGDTSVWVLVDGEGECIRFFSSGLNDSNGLVHVWFHGDRMKLRKDLYNRFSSEHLQRLAADRYQWHGIPYVRLSRPGTHGSTGYHGNRRRPRESKVVNAALSKIKERYKVEKFALSGHSGGGHVVASLLIMRADVSCAVITSGNISVRERIALKNWTTDATGYNDYFDPIDHVENILRNPELQIFVVGDPRDTNVEFETQESYFKALKMKGYRAWLIRGNGRRNHHDLAWLGFDVVEWCVNGVPQAEIVKRAEKAE